MGQVFTIHFVSGESRARADAARLLLALGYHAEVYADFEELLRHPPGEGLILAQDDVKSGGAAGIVSALDASGIWLPLVLASASDEVARIVDAVKAGAFDYLLLPLSQGGLASVLKRAARGAGAHAAARKKMIGARLRIEGLSTREREVLELLVEGGSNKLIARTLSISPRTVEIHRSNMMSKLGVKHVAEAVRLSFEARLS